MNVGRVYGLIAAGCVVWASTGTALAAESVKVGVVQQRTIFEKTALGKKKMAEMREYQTSRERIIVADDAELKKLESELKAQESRLSEAEKVKKQQQFQAKFEAFQRKYQDFQREFQQRQKQVSDEFQKKVDEAVQAVAEKGGFTAVIDEGSVATIKVVLYAHPSVDLTEQVIKEFDRRNK